VGPSHWLGGHELPEFLMAFQDPVVLGTNDGVQVGRTDLHRIMQLVQVAFAVSQHHQLGLGHAAGGGGGRLERFEPTTAFLFVDRFGVATARFGRGCFRPRPPVGPQ
jgi:hypothetical protein